MTDDDYMDRALREAEDAFTRGDWPVGSVLVRDGIVLATGQNRQNTERDVTWHAEFEALRRAMREHGLEKLTGATVYSTMEPCPMCAGAMKAFGIARLVLGTRHATLRRTDLGEYSVESFCRLTGYDLAITNGIREPQCTALRRRWGQRPGPPLLALRPEARHREAMCGGGALAAMLADCSSAGFAGAVDPGGGTEERAEGERRPSEGGQSPPPRLSQVAGDAGEAL